MHDATAGHHLDGDAELYALGALGLGERMLADHHLESCAACRADLAAAQRTVAALDDAFIEQREPPALLGARIRRSARLAARPPSLAVRVRPYASRLATAAAFVFAIGAGAIATGEHATAVAHAARENAILGTIAHSHFMHVTLKPRVSGAPTAKVLYAPNGSWMYGIVDRADCACRIVSRSANGDHDLGAAESGVATSTFFARDPGHAQSIALVDDTGRVLADGPLQE